jgi:uncharacterized protein YeeX (DUF496 family)
MDQSFSEADKQKVIEFLNTVAKYAKFEMKTEEIVSYFKLLAHMQQTILPKIDANILEVLKVGKVPEIQEEPKLKDKKSK